MRCYIDQATHRRASTTQGLSAFIQLIKETGTWAIEKMSFKVQLTYMNEQRTILMSQWNHQALRNIHLCQLICTSYIFLLRVLTTKMRTDIRQTALM